MNGYGRGQENGRKEGLSSVVTRETFGMTLLLFSVVLLVICIIGSYMLGEIGVAITAFFMGIFGFFVYPVLVFGILVSLKMISGKKIFSWKWALRCGAVLGSVFLIVHLSTSSRFFGAGFGAYMNGCWHAAETSVSGGTGGGVLFGLVVYPLRALLSTVGAYIIFSCLTALSVFFLLWATPFKKLVKGAQGERRERREAPSERKEDRRGEEESLPPRSYEPRPSEAFGEPRGEEPRYGRPAPAYGGRYDASYEEPSYERAPAAARGSVYNTPYAEEFDRYTPPAENTPTPNEARDFLFGADPAASYSKNLAFSRDSQYNNHVRRSSVSPETPFPPSAQPASRGSVSPFGSSFTSSYGEGFSAQAQDARPRMPRKITEQAPAQTFSSFGDLNYTRQPSYKAPDAPENSAAQSFYRNDVPFEEQFSSAPNVDDLPDPAPVRAVRPAPEPVQPVQNDFRSAPEPAQSGELRRAPREPAPEPVKSEPRDLFSRDSDVFSREETARETPPARDLFTRDETPFTRDETPFSRDENFPQSDGFSAPAGEEPVRGRDDLFSDDDFSGSRFPEEDAGESRAMENFRSRADLFDDDDTPAPVRREREAPAHPIPQAAAPKPAKHVYRPYVRPSLSLFRRYDETLTVGKEEIEHNSQIIVETLAGFKLDVEVMRVAVGPSVTRYDINIPQNVSVGTVTRTAETVAMRLHAVNGVNMYSNNEQGLISIEVPNSVRATVGVRSILQSEEYLNDKPGALTFAIGKDLEGRSVCGNLTKMKHILVAGATGSGKSVCLNAMLISLLCKYSPEDLRLILIDPKKVEFAVYDGLPHLMINEIIADAQKAVTALNWAIKEMERRYELFEQKTRTGTVVRELDEYNARLTGDEQKLPKIVIVVDELADLMAVAKKDIEERIQRLTQKARAAGLHLVIATQRPSVDVITGVIKGNLPTRMAFRVIQEVDSRTILDESGAQKLLGNGDMLYRTEGMFYSLRVQGAFLSSDEVQSILSEIKANNEAYFDPEVADYINRTESDSASGDFDGDSDGAVSGEYLRALSMVVKLGQASISLIQRRCSIGYNHAGKIIEWMELMGYISPFDGKAKARTVLLTKEEFESKYGPLD